MNTELFPGYDAVEARREQEIRTIKEKLAGNESADTPVCRVERVSATSATLRFGLKRGKLLYLFKYPTHDVERQKHRNVIARGRFIKNALETAGYRLIPWDFNKAQPPAFWERDRTMDDEDDDLYGPAETVAPVTKHEEPKDVGSGSDQGDEPMDEGLETGEESEDESDSDLEIIIDKPQTAPKATAPAPPQESKAIKIEAPPQPGTTPSTKPSATTATIGNQGAPSQLGTSYPAVRTSTLDVNADPIYPPVGKPISQIDIDADLAESTKPWRLPGADQSDYFNYGFDEFTWEMYRNRQSGMTAALNNQKNEMAQFQQMFMPGMGPAQPPVTSGAGGPGPGVGANPGGVPGAPTGPAAAQQAAGGMPGMGDDQMAMMMQQMQQMQASGMDMGNMDFNTFMQMAGGMGGGFPGGGGQQQQPGYGGGQQGGQGGGGGGGGGGRGGGRRGRGGW